MKREVEITYACGHTHTVLLQGKEDYIEWKAKQMAEDDCPDCIEKARQEENERCAAENKENGFCELIGSDRQIGWAEKIRSNYLTWLMDIEKEERMILDCMKNKEGEKFETHTKFMNYLKKQAEKDIKAMSNAGFIIDNRSEWGLKRVLSKKAAEWEEPEVEEETVTKVYEPEEQKKDGFVQIERGHTQDGDECLTASYMRDNTFVSIMHKYGFGFSYADNCWKKESGSASFESLNDLGADLANYLIARGFRVKTRSEGIQTLLETQSWNPVNFRVLSLDKSGNYFIFQTDAETDEVIADIPKAIRMDRWNKSYAQKYKVHVSLADVVLDAAETYGFAISSEARSKLKEIEKAKYERIVPRDIQPKPIEERRKGDEIIADLIDD